MKIAALAPWFGAKRAMADVIVRHLGPHHAYFEPFCGSMAVLLAKEPCRQEAVNDLHGDLVNLARVVRDEHLSARLYWRLRRTLVSEELFRESLAAVKAGGPPGGPCADRAYHYFVASWLGMNGVAGTERINTNFCRRYSSKGGAPGTRFVSVVESLPDWHERLRAVEIYSGCGIEICERVEDRAGTVVYADPPYIGPGDRYEHGFTPGDHERLAAALGRLRETRVVVSYYDHPDLARLYPGFEKVDVARPKHLVNSGKRVGGKADAPEVLLVRNGGAV